MPAIPAFVKLLVLRAILPSLLFIACAIRPSIISLLYGFLAFLALLIPVPQFGGPGLAARYYVLLSLVVCMLCFVAQLSTQIYMFSEPKAHEKIGPCGNSTELILRTFGLQQLTKESIGQSARLILPEVFALLGSIIGIVTIVIFDTSTANTNASPTSRTALIRDSLKSHQCCHVLVRISEFAVVLMACLVGSIQPCLLSFVYYAAFLAILIWWGAHKPIANWVTSCVKLCLAIFGIGHLALIYSYQMDAFQNKLKPTDLTARLLGLVPLFNSSCPDPWDLQAVSNAEWYEFAHPAVLLLFIVMLVFQRRASGGAQPPRSPKLLDASADDASSVHEELLANAPSTNERRPPARGFSIGTTPFSGEESGFYGFLGTVFDTLLRHSYALSLVAMMAWALLYHTWLTFVWLILACIIWIYPKSQKFYFTVAPFVAIYAVGLLLIEYMFSLNVLEDEMNTDNTVYKQVGIWFDKENPWKRMWIKTLLTLPFFVTLRLSTRDRQRRNDPNYGTFGDMPMTHHESGLSFFEGDSFVGRVACKYWIYLVALILLLNSISVDVKMYSIGYMIFFIVLVAALVVSFTVVRGILFMYLTLLLVYSSAVIISIYLFQFSGVPQWFHNVTGLSDGVLSDIGLEDYKNDAAPLVHQLLAPIAFMVFCAIQLKFFNRTFLKITGVDGNIVERTQAAQPQTHANAVHNQEQGACQDGHKPPKKWYLVYWDQALKLYKKVVDLSWRLSELHIRKLVPFAIIMVAAFEVSLFNLALVVLAVVMLFLPFLYKVSCLLACVWIGVIILLKMIFRLSSVAGLLVDRVDNMGTNGTCTNLDFDSLCDKPLNNSFGSNTLLNWVGIENDAYKIIGDYLAGMVIVLVALCVQAIIEARQKWLRKVNGLGQPVNKVLFPNITRSDADLGTWKCIQFFANYFFYKFGVEVCFSMTMIVIAIRMDAIAFIYAICLLVLFALSRHTQRYVWYGYTILLVILLPVQYASCVGFPWNFCVVYPWETGKASFNATSPECQRRNKLVEWLYLPSYQPQTRPNAKNLIADFFQLLFVCYQLFVFRIESAEGENYEGGDNSQTYLKIRMIGQPRRPNPTYDYITNKRCSLDYIKGAVFQYFQWVALIMVFVAGLGGGVSLFALGYLIVAFLFLWRGNDLYLKPIGTIIAKWRGVTYYTIVIIGLKVALQVLGCVYAKDLHRDVCWLSQLLSIVCAIPGDPPVKDAAADAKCTVAASEASVTYDVLCFIFLVIQLRILGSHYFKHVVVEFRAQKVLSSRGAVLINQLTEKELREQEAIEESIFECIRKRVISIKKRYDKQVESGQQGPEPTNYAEAESKSVIRAKRKASIWVDGGPTLLTAKRQGDYFMFDYNPDEDEALIVEPRDVPGFDPEAEEQKGMDPLQMIHTAINTDMDLREVNKKEDRVRAASSGPEEEEEEVPPPFVEDEDVIPSAEKKPVKKKRKVSSSDEGEEDECQPPAAQGFVKRFVISVLDFLSAKFNRLSRDYRYVEFVLKKEKQALKEQFHEGLGDLTRSTHELRREWVEGEMGRSVKIVKNEDDLERLSSEVSKVEENCVLRLLIAIYNVLAANTDLLCFLFMAANHAASASILSLPLPLMAFLWGTLCNPRPPKFFWIVVISYTEAIVIVKFLFQFGFFPWNDKSGTATPDWYWPPRLLGIIKTEKFAAWDVALLIVVFFHRYMLRRLGLWKDILHPMGTEEVDAANQSDANSVNSVHSAETSKGGPEESIELQDITPQVQADPQHTTQEVDKRSRYGGGCANFFNSLLKPAFRIIRDLYPWMFLCDFICILLLVFGFQSFYVSSTGGDVLADIQSSRVPLPFVVMLILMVFLIVVDRAIYLRKSVFAKLIFQLIIVLGLHAWIFFALPAMTDEPTNEKGLVQVWYMVKCIYLLFGAWQIRNGYPSRVLGNLLTRSYNIVSFSLFTGFMAIPFIFEIRTVIDWVWTETSMPVFDFFNMENYFAKIYQLKCMRKLETDFPAPRGQPKGKIVKWAMGIPMLVLIIGCIFLPLLLFSLLNYIGTNLPPDAVKFSITIQGYPPLYRTTSQGWWIEDMVMDEEKQRHDDLTAIFKNDRASQAFLKEYYQDGGTLEVMYQEASVTAWDISPPARKSLIKALEDKGNKLAIVIDWEFRRPREKPSEDPKIHTGQREINMTETLRKQFVQLLNGSDYDKKILIDRAYPPYVIIPQAGEVMYANTLFSYLKDPKTDPEILSPEEREEEYAGFVPLELQLNVAKSSFVGGPMDQYWSVKTRYTPENEKYLLTIEPGYNATGFMMIAFVDKVFPSAFKSFTGGGIIGVYVALVLVVGKLIRGIVTNEPLDVIISEMPFVDRVLKICLDIYLVREARDFFLEQDLYSRLIFLFRSPETLIKWTKPQKPKTE